jgi:hypothetical protein
VSVNVNWKIFVKVAKGKIETRKDACWALLDLDPQPMTLPSVKFPMPHWQQPMESVNLHAPS